MGWRPPRGVAEVGGGALVRVSLARHAMQPPAPLTRRGVWFRPVVAPVSPATLVAQSIRLVVYLAVALTILVVVALGFLVGCGL